MNGDKVMSEDSARFLFHPGEIVGIIKLARDCQLTWDVDESPFLTLTHTSHTGIEIESAVILQGNDQIAGIVDESPVDFNKYVRLQESGKMLFQSEGSGDALQRSHLRNSCWD